MPRPAFDVRIGCFLLEHPLPREHAPRSWCHEQQYAQERLIKLFIAFLPSTVGARSGIHAVSRVSAQWLTFLDSWRRSSMPQHFCGRSFKSNIVSRIASELWPGLREVPSKVSTNLEAGINSTTFRECPIDERPKIYAS